MSRVVVVGSLNLDLVTEVGHLPSAGETIIGGELRRLSGGKGGNQAHAAAGLAAAGTSAVEVAMIACVGDDEAGSRLRSDLAAAGVDTGGIIRIPGIATGTALITVAPDGANAIVVVPGANRAWPADALSGVALDAGDVVVAQLEVPIEAVRSAGAAARAAGARLVLNAAPADDRVQDVLGQADVVVVNEIEAEQLLGLRAGADGGPDLRAVAEARSRIEGDLVVTLGADGAVVATRGGRVVHVPGLVVDAIDTVGAGDAFVGALAASLASGADLIDAVSAGNAVGSLTATVRGARHPRLASALVAGTEAS